MNRSRIVYVLGAAAALAAGPVFFQGSRLQAQESPGLTAQPAPAWKFKDLDGHEVSAAQFKGKVVVLDFWATWCGPCIGEIPSYVELQKKYGKDGLVVIGALTHDPKTPAKVREFAAKLGMNYTIVVSDDATEEAFGGFDAIPTTFLIGRDGRIVHRKTGALPPADYEKLVKQALH
jgi:thiol-disulfide isomerase/thioredoxin